MATLAEATTILPFESTAQPPALVSQQGDSQPGNLASAAALSDDYFEENDYRSTSRNLGTIAATTTYDGLVMADAHDWYRIYLPASGTVDDAVAINFANSQGDLDLRLYNSAGSRLRTSATTANGERISLSGLSAGTYYIDVAGYYGAKNPAYSLTINRKAALVDDAYEQNDSISAARDLGSLTELRTVSNLVMADSADWYRFSMNAAGTSADFVQIGFQHAQGNLQLALYNSSGSFVSSSSGSTNVEQISLAGRAAGTYYVRVYGYGGATNPNYTLKIDPAAGAAAPAPADPGGYNIEFVFSGLSSTHQAIFKQAAAKWESVIVGDLPDINYYGRLVDDLLIKASASAIDGVGGILGQAGPDYVRSGSLLPVHGTMEFDSADMNDMIANGTFLGVILHEMGHVLGVGTLWEDLGLISGAGTSNPQYVGTQGRAAYNAIFGTSAAGVPVEAGGGAGTRDAHWRESVFRTELMTGWVGPGSNMPLSRITVGSLADMGYTVNLAAVDTYTPPTTVLAASTSGTTSGSTSAALQTAAGSDCQQRRHDGQREADSRNWGRPFSGLLLDWEGLARSRPEHFENVDQVFAEHLDRLFT